MPGHVLSGDKWVPYDEELAWREEAFGERPVLGPWGDPFHDEEPLECSLDDIEVCEACD